MSQITEMQVESSATATEVDGIELREVVGRLSDADARAVDVDLTRMASLASAPALNAVERASFPRVVIEEAKLSEGRCIVHHNHKGSAVHRIAWDPTQTSRDKVEVWINIHVAGPGAYVERAPESHLALRHVDEVRTRDLRPEVIELWDVIERAVINSADPLAALEGICNLVIAESDVIKAEREATA